MKSAYPKTMVHPQERKGTARAVVGEDAISGRKFTDYQGTPDRFSPVSVENEDQEAEYRAKGYFMQGEEMPKIGDFKEYPVWMRHPEYRPASIPDQYGRSEPEQFPDALAKNEDHELSLIDKGYERPGKSDPVAVATAKAMPYDPNRKDQEYPKWVDGKLVDPDAPTGGIIEYPKWVGDILVNSRAEEDELTGVKEPEPSADVDRDHLIAKAEKLGVKIDKRWNAKKLQEALEAA